MRSVLTTRRLAGFSLTELVVVLAVISLIAAIAVPTFSNVRTNAAASAAQASAEAAARNAFALAVQDPSSYAVSAGLFGDKLLVSSREADGISMSGDDGTPGFEPVSRRRRSRTVPTRCSGR
jgi:prepilin-type N-terminal cleavage/methylation domain-containing protein